MKKLKRGFIPIESGFIPKKSGFTLMELLIVMVLLAILSSVVMGNFASSSKRGRDARRKSDLQSLQTALEAYFNDKGQYPTSNSGVMMGCGTLDAQACPWGGQFKDKNNTVYMVVLPDDPSETQTYYYASNTTSYVLYAKLENTRDTGTGVLQTGYTNEFTGGATNCSNTSTVSCTYAVASQDVSL